MRGVESGEVVADLYYTAEARCWLTPEFSCEVARAGALLPVRNVPRPRQLQRFVRRHLAGYTVRLYGHATDDHYRVAAGTSLVTTWVLK